MNTSYTSNEQEIQQNSAILEEILDSGSICCFDESILMSLEGVRIVHFLRRKLGSSKFYHLPGLAQKLEEKETELEGRLQKIQESPEYKLPQTPRKLVNQITRLEANLQAVRIAKGLDLKTKSLPHGKAFIMLTADINLAEYLGKRSGKSCVFLLCHNKELRRWHEVREPELKKTQDSLGKILIDKSCWLASSALASARLSRFAEAVQELPRTIQERVMIIDSSARKAEEKNPGNADSIKKLISHCGIQALEKCLPSATEDELLSLAIYHAAKDKDLITIWNDKDQAERVRQIVKSRNGGDQLRRVAFCQFTWFGNLEELNDFSENPLAKTLFGRNDAEEENASPLQPPTISSLAIALGEKTSDIKKALIRKHRDNIKNTPLSNEAALSNEDFRYLCEEVFPEKISGRTPDEQTIRTIGSILGKQISRLSLEEIKNIINDAPARRELSIIYARRWEITHILKNLLNEAHILSPYCFENWFKRSQNAQHNMSLEDLMLNNTYYSFLRQVITKTPIVDPSGDAVKKLQLLKSSAVISEVSKRAGGILELLAGKMRN